MTTYTQTTTDWPGRYYHVDQVLDKPGPRTDPEMFVGGDTVRYLSTYIGCLA
jgi:NEDD8-activating enzyme E1